MTSTDSSLFTTKAVRIQVACVTCRDRKVKVGSSYCSCATFELIQLLQCQRSGGDEQPCNRCTKHKLNCEFKTVGEQTREPSSGLSRRRSTASPPARSQSPYSHSRSPLPYPLGRASMPESSSRHQSMTAAQAVTSSHLDFEGQATEYKCLQNLNSSNFRSESPYGTSQWSYQSMTHPLSTTPSPLYANFPDQAHGYPTSSNQAIPHYGNQNQLIPSSSSFANVSWPLNPAIRLPELLRVQAPNRDHRYDSGDWYDYQ
ncbi:hypothetical protein C8J56DRAFT_1092852 [Mycena floridula]|nr:hypothetical protein C8J56DRAFT_1092852 [Mycena floridula]